ncbi:MAG: ferritin family protein [Candidatus Alcyoniella australis]|nr:ferritin family protein [Candidatus Alcyoniella australis]
MTTQIEAIVIARQAEDRAAHFYADAALGCADPRGKDLFEQLARYESTHRDKLDEMIESLQGGNGYPEYGDEPQRINIDEAGADRVSESGDVLDIISQAIQAERNAAQSYRELAASTDDPAGRQVFERLIQEELLHERVLNDQFYALTNEGFWAWGE